MELVKARVVLDMFKTVNYYICLRANTEGVCSSVYEDCSCISCWALYKLLQNFLPNLIVKVAALNHQPLSCSTSYGNSSGLSKAFQNLVGQRQHNQISCIKYNYARNISKKLKVQVLIS